MNLFLLSWRFWLDIFERRVEHELSLLHRRLAFLGKRHCYCIVLVSFESHTVMKRLRL